MKISLRLIYLLNCPPTKGEGGHTGFRLDPGRQRRSDSLYPLYFLKQWGQICNVKPHDTATIRSTELLARLGIEDLDLVLEERRLRWYGHMARSNGAVKTAFELQVDGKCGPGRPKMTWKQLTERDRREWKFSAIDPHDRDTWRAGVRSAMPAASQLPGRGPTVVDMAPVSAR